MRPTRSGPVSSSVEHQRSSKYFYFELAVPLAIRGSEFPRLVPRKLLANQIFECIASILETRPLRSKGFRVFTLAQKAGNQSGCSHPSVLLRPVSVCRCCRSR